MHDTQCHACALHSVVVTSRDTLEKQFLNISTFSPRHGTHWLALSRIPRTRSRVLPLSARRTACHGVIVVPVWGLLKFIVFSVRVAVWLIVNALASINVVAIHQTRLVPRWVTVTDRLWAGKPSQYVTSQLGDSAFYPPWVVKWVLAFGLSNNSWRLLFESFALFASFLLYIV